MKYSKLEVENSTFDRGLKQEFIDILNNSEAWERIRECCDLKPFIRKDEVHVYHKGCKVFGLRQRNKRIVFETHQKYLDKFKNTELRSNPYIEYNEELIDIDNNLIADDTNFVNLMNSIVENTKNHSHGEKTDIHNIIIENPSILDVEVSFGGINGKNKNDKEINLHKRIDFAILSEFTNSNKIELRFYESKQYSYTSSLRVSGEIDAPIISQLKLYDDLLEHHEENLCQSYENIIRQFSKLKIDNWHKYVDKKITISLKTKLIITDIPELKPQSKNAWEKHLKKIESKRGSTNICLLPQNEYKIS